MKVGQRVRNEIHGLGTVKVKDHDDCVCFGVEFDKEFSSGHDLGRRYKKGHCWWCDEDDLKLVEENEMRKENIEVGRIYKFTRNEEGDKLEWRDCVEKAAYANMIGTHGDHMNCDFLDENKQSLGGALIQDAAFSELREIEWKVEYSAEIVDGGNKMEKSRLFKDKLPEDIQVLREAGVLNSDLKVTDYGRSVIVEKVLSDKKFMAELVTEEKAKLEAKKEA